MEQTPEQQLQKILAQIGNDSRAVEDNIENRFTKAGEDMAKIGEEVDEIKEQAEKEIGALEQTAEDSQELMKLMKEGAEDLTKDDGPETEE